MTRRERERKTHIQKRIDEMQSECVRLETMLKTHKFSDEERERVNTWIYQLNDRISHLQSKIRNDTVDRLCGGKL